MARFIKSKKEAIGMSPDEIFFRGEQKSDFTEIKITDYNSDSFIEKNITNLKEAIEFEKEGTSTWLNIDGLHDEKLMQEISDLFDIDPIIISDILNPHLRPKIQEYDNCIFISVKMLKYNEIENYSSTENFVLLIKKNILISFQEIEGDVFDPIRERLRKNKKIIRSAGTDYLAFALLDIIIDNYIYIISQIGEKIELLDDKLINDTSKYILEEINNNKSEINYLRKIIKPSREMILNLSKMDSELLDQNIKIHFKELQDNINLANESVDSYREILSDQINIYHSSISNKLNDILKFLTIFSVIFIPLTFIAGIYGTNFDNIPELHFKYGYYMMWGVIIIVALSMIFYFKRKNWF